MEQYFEKLEEDIKDDDKIVTITSFAIEADISFEESKKIIEKYVEINKASKEISVTYILNGKKRLEDLQSVSLIKDESLEEEIQFFEDDVKQTIFSIQKAKQIDFIVISLADSVGNDEKKDPLTGAIVGKKCIKRILHKKVLPIIPPATIKGKSTLFTKQNNMVQTESYKVEKEDKINQNNKSKANTQGNIASLFSKAAQNKKPDQKDNKPQEKRQKVNGKLSNFFAQQSSNNFQVKKEASEKESKEILNNVDPTDDDTDDAILKDLKINSKTAKNSNSNGNKKPDLFDSDTDEEILKDLEMKKEITSEKKGEKKKEQAKIIQSKNKSSQKKKRSKNDVGNIKAAKKRKRIIVDESDSDDIFGSDKSDSEDVIEKSDEEQEVKIDKKPPPPKNKRRKAVEKMYEDEDGYLVTKTEYVYETPSEDENEPDNKIPKVEEKPKPKIEKNSNSENEISPNKGAKTKKVGNKKAPAANQPTLMNFFKKK